MRLHQLHRLCFLGTKAISLVLKQQGRRKSHLSSPMWPGYETTRLLFTRGFLHSHVNHVITVHCKQTAHEDWE